MPEIDGKALGAAAKVLTQLAEAAPKEAAAAEAGQAVAAAAKASGGGITATGLFGFTAGTVGLGLTGYNLWKQTFGSTDADKLRSSGVLGPPTYAMGAGMGMLLLAEKGGLASQTSTEFLRYASIALILGGVTGAALGAIPTFHNPKDQRARNDPSIRKPSSFPTVVPKTVKELDGLELASAQVPTTTGDLKRLSVYIDPATAKKTKAKTLDGAIIEARAGVQADATDRSQAVVQTADGAYWIARLTGDLDQIDGRWYTDKTDFDPRFPVQMVRKHPALQAVVGVATKVTFDDPRPTTGTATPDSSGTADTPAGAATGGTPAASAGLVARTARPLTSAPSMYRAVASAPSSPVPSA
jgi:hypothetical protein